MDVRQDVRRIARLADGDPSMSVAVTERLVALPAIHQEGAARLDRGGDEAAERTARQILEHGQAEAPRAVLASLDGPRKASGHERFLAVPLPTTPCGL